MPFLTHSKFPINTEFPSASWEMNSDKHTAAHPCTSELYAPRMKGNNNGPYENHTVADAVRASSGELVALAIFSIPQIPGQLKCHGALSAPNRHILTPPSPPHGLLNEP